MSSRRAPSPIAFADLTPKQKVIASGVMRMLKAFVGGRALNILKALPEADMSNGFEAWRRLFQEYQPRAGGRAVSLLEAVLES